MKYILSTILISLILTSCSTQKEQQSIISSVPVIQSWIIQTDTIVSSTWINTGIISTGSAIAKVRTLWMENNNIVLLEDGKKLDDLTTKGSIDFSNVESCDIPKEKTAYKILQATGEYGVVQKVKNTCGGVVEKVYYSIWLTSNAYALQEVYKGFDTVKVNGSIITITNADEVVNSENEEWMGIVAKSTLIKEWYKQQGKDWIRTISLGAINITTPQNTTISAVSTDTIVWKYSKTEPLQDGYSTDVSIEIKQGKSSDYSVVFSATYIQPDTTYPIQYDWYGTIKKEWNIWKLYWMERATNSPSINCEAELTFDNKKLVIKQIALKPDPKLIGTTQCSVLNEKWLIKK